MTNREDSAQPKVEPDLPRLELRLGAKERNRSRTSEAGGTHHLCPARRQVAAQRWHNLSVGHGVIRLVPDPRQALENSAHDETGR